MILESFTLAGKVAIVTGCDTGLGQGMAVALAQAGCDIVGVNRKVPDETAARITALGRRFMAIRADLGQQESIQRVVDSAVAEMGRVDILVNNAGTIRREDATAFSEKDWDDVVNLNLKSVFPLSGGGQTVYPTGSGWENHQYCLDAFISGGSACLLTLRLKAVFWVSRACSPTNGLRMAST